MSVETKDPTKFETWVELLAWVEFDGILQYQSPTELQPLEVRCIRHVDTVIVTTLDGDHICIAEEAHLPRFSYEKDAA